MKTGRHLFENGLVIGLTKCSNLFSMSQRDHSMTLDVPIDDSGSGSIVLFTCFGMHCNIVCARKLYVSERGGTERLRRFMQATISSLFTRDGSVFETMNVTSYQGIRSMDPLHKTLGWPIFTRGEEYSLSFSRLNAHQEILRGFKMPCAQAFSRRNW